jgi:hypothetical protein
LRCGINFLEELPHHGTARFGEAQKLVVIPVLVSATNGEPESFVGDRDVLPTVLGNDLICLDSLLGEFLHQILGETSAPYTRIDLFFLALVARKFERSQFDLSLHEGVSGQEEVELLE